MLTKMQASVKNIERGNAMLIDFTVENFRSFKAPVTLSMVEHRGAGATRQGKGRRTLKPDSEIAPASQVEGRNFALLPAVGIFGANASGKSNLVHALDTMLTYIVHGNEFNKHPLEEMIPFKLDEGSANAPTSFRLRVARQSSIFTYQLEVDRKRIRLERLELVPPPPRRARLLFERRWNPIDGSYHWKNGSDFAGPHLQLQPRLNESLPYLTLLVKQIEVDVIKSLITWLQGRFFGLSLGQEELERFITAEIVHKHGGKDDLISFLRGFDTGLADVEVEDVDLENMPRSGYRIIAVHDTPHGRIRWPFREESTGTQRLLGLSYKLVGSLQTGELMVVDELGSNIHPAITRRLIRLFQNPMTNRANAQLVFTSHDNTLQRNQLLRRDQIWFTEKISDGSTTLYPLSGFQVRNDLAIDRAYLDGRFGAVPILPDETEMLQTVVHAQ